MLRTKQYFIQLRIPANQPDDLVAACQELEWLANSLHAESGTVVDQEMVIYQTYPQPKDPHDD